jgi:oxygen-dependent protoporphyrinogen oxidase
MQELIDTLVGRLPAGSVCCDAPVTAINYEASRRSWQAATRGGQVLHADGVILAVPAFHAAEILNSVAGDAANELRKISYASTATVSLAYRREVFSRQPDSFGFVVPAIERRKIMACTFSSFKYPGRAPEGGILLRAFVGGALQPELFDANNSDMEKNVRDELANLLGVTAVPLFSRIRRYPNSMPQYHLGHEARIRQVESSLGQFSTLALAGSAYHGVGISDCVRTGEEAAEKVVGHLESNSLSALAR